MGRKHCGKRRNCSLRAISPFPTVFWKGSFPGASKGVIVWEWVKIQIWSKYGHFYEWTQAEPFFFFFFMTKQGGISKAWADMLRRQNAERLKLERELMKEEQDALGLELEQHESKRKHTVDNLTDNLATSLQGILKPLYSKQDSYSYDHEWDGFWVICLNWIKLWLTVFSSFLHNVFLQSVSDCYNFYFVRQFPCHPMHIQDPSVWSLDRKGKSEVSSTLHSLPKTLQVLPCS